MERSGYGRYGGASRARGGSVLSPQAARARIGRRAPDLQRSQRSEYYFDSPESSDGDDDGGRGGGGGASPGAFERVSRHLEPDRSDQRWEDSSSDDDVRSDGDAEELLRLYLDGVTAKMEEVEEMRIKTEAMSSNAALATRDGTRGYRDLDEAASRAGAGQLPDAVKTATLAGLLRAATSDKHRKVDKYRRPMTGTLKAQAVIREEVEMRLEQILEIADNVWEWLKEDEESHNEMMSYIMELFDPSADLDATFLEPGPIGLSFGCVSALLLV